MNSLERIAQIEIDSQIDEIEAAVDRVLESIPASELIDAINRSCGEISFTAKAGKAERLTSRGQLADRAPANSMGKGGRGESPEPPPARRSSWERRLDAGGVIPVPEHDEDDAPAEDDEDYPDLERDLEDDAQ